MTCIAKNHLLRRIAGACVARMSKPTYATIAEKAVVEVNDVDRAIDARTTNRERARQLAEISMKILDAMGDRPDVWFEYERLAGLRTADRDAAAFNLGVEHGRAFERARAARNASQAVRDLAVELRSRALADANRADATAALVLAAWSLLQSCNRNEISP